MNTKSFDVIYQELYENIGKELETKIKKQRNTFLKLVGLFVILMIIIYILGNIEMFFLFLIGCCFVSIFYLFKIQELKLKYYREEIIKYLVKNLNVNLNYDYNVGLNESDYISSKLPEKYDDFQSRDSIYGRIEDDIDFKLSYINTYKKEICVVDDKQQIEKIETFNIENEMERNVIIIKKIKNTPNKFPRGQGKPLKEPIR